MLLAIRKPAFSGQITDRLISVRHYMQQILAACFGESHFGQENIILVVLNQKNDFIGSLAHQIQLILHRFEKAVSICAKLFFG
jgi:hypothetical protein